MTVSGEHVYTVTFVVDVTAGDRDEAVGLAREIVSGEDFEPVEVLMEGVTARAGEGW